MATQRPESPPRPSSLTPADLAFPLFRRAPIAMTLTRAADGRFHDANDRFCELTGYAREELLGKTTVDVGLFPDAVSRDRTLHDYRRDGFVRDQVIVLRRKSGALLHVQANLDPFDVSGEACILGFLVDVTAQREVAVRKSEAKLRLALDQSAVGVAISSNGHWVDVNRAMCNMLGYTREELLAANWEGVTDPEDLANSHRVLKSVLPHSEGEILVEKRFRHKDGRVIFAEVYASAIRDPDGSNMQFMSHIINVTARKHAEAEARHQVVARTVVRRFLRDLIAQGQSSTNVRRGLGRSIGQETTAPDIQEHLDAYRTMNIGSLSLEKVENGRYAFSGTGLLEMTPGFGQPTCHIALGYLEGAVANLNGGTSLGTETRCQSQGHPTCQFVVRSRSAPSG